MSVYATVDDLAKKYPLPSGRLVEAGVYLEEAQALLLRLVPGLADGISAGTVSLVLVRKVLTDAVKRVMETPSGIQSQTVGPETVTYVSNRSVREVMFTDAELALLTPPGSGISGEYAVGSARLGLPSYARPGPRFASEVARFW